MANGTVQGGRFHGLAKVAGLALGLAMFGATGLSGALAQDDEVTISGGASLAEGVSASDIEALVNSILAEIFGEAAIADEGMVADDSMTTGGGDINVGGNMGSSVTMGGGMGGDISIGGASGGISVGETESGG